MASLFHLFLFFLVIGFASSSYISKEVIEPHGSLGRSLLQEKSTCSVDIQNLNYTTVTSQCQGPNYPPETCCTLLKKLICPIKDQVNDATTDCADTFFSYINLNGNYPPGLLAALCQKNEQTGIDCDGYIVNIAPPGPYQGNGLPLASAAQSIFVSAAQSIFLVAGLLLHMFQI